MLLMSISEQAEILWIAMLTSVGQDFGLLKGGMIGSVADWIGQHMFYGADAFKTLLIISLPVACFKALTLYWSRFL
ncbi:MAG: hypothetical protein KGQ54_04750, partial [Verrucomicrobia bacterium]|nr:hypothetical protein [Verrucomicrobiota bacterium]